MVTDASHLALDSGPSLDTDSSRGFPNLHAVGTDARTLTAALERHDRAAISRLRLLWTYYRNPMESRSPSGHSGGLAARGFRLAQERGLPARLLGTSRSVAADDRTWGRKEIVVENDIAWRIHAMVDFMFGQRVRISSTAENPARRAIIDQVLDAVWEAAGGVAFLQDVALLGNVYGSVDLIVRAVSPSGSREHASTPRIARGGEGDGDEAAGAGDGAPAPALDAQAAIAAARSSVRIELIEPTRGVALLSASDYRRIDAYALRYHDASHTNDDQPVTPRLNLWRRVLKGLGEFEEAFNSASDQSPTILEVVGPHMTNVYRSDSSRRQRWTLVRSTPSLINPDRDGEVPIVHIQNLSQPFEYDGLSEVEPLIPLQDELNTRLSDRASRVTLQSFKMYLAKGIDPPGSGRGPGSLPIEPGTVWTTDNPSAQIVAFGGDSDAPSESEHIEQVREAMDKQSGVPPLASGVVRAKIGNLSSENALKVTLMGLLSKTARKRVSYGRGIAKASQLVLEALDEMGVLKTTPAERAVRVDWPDPLPRDERQELDAAIKKIELGVPRERVLSDLGYTSIDPGVE